MFASGIMNEEGWKRFGLIKGPGLPAPGGQYTVGCVDLMHKLEGDDDGLLVRLFYPTTPQIQAEGAAGYQYAKWMPDKRYVKASLTRSGSRFPGLFSTVTSLILGMISFSVLNYTPCDTQLLMLHQRLVNTFVVITAKCLIAYI